MIYQHEETGNIVETDSILDYPWFKIGRQKMKDTVDISYITRDGLNSLNMIDVQRVNPPETMAWFVILLKYIPDSEEVFPLGKWATIQEIERQLQECAKHRMEVMNKGAK